ncbi:hypothetical protein A0J52_01700 [Clostridium sporogenes]|uniref:hypothetical protein n=1 Tax=Clostridium sporogenes TaxID=1509 RepID=UPI00077FEFF2|nr:hypothetical protein [Clostridium sporogenes]KYN78024.1 hypothetical protein A0J52_01700 [Clostridium sporogenes]MCW6076137.1 hypothetical protein [Clostridium sporogenes]MCW6111068.1 hypothetical protein [Clostridium sporogenes]
MIYNQYFTIYKSSKDIIEKFIDFLYFWGPDYDDSISKINKLLKENKLKEASDLCVNIKY